MKIVPLRATLLVALLGVTLLLPLSNSPTSAAPATYSCPTGWTLKASSCSITSHLTRAACAHVHGTWLTTNECHRIQQAIKKSTSTSYPVGIPDPSEPSGFAPPPSNAVPGYSEIYSTDFPGNTMPSYWPLYSGQPGGDPGALFAQSQVGVTSGVLTINTSLQPGAPAQWLTGGTCLCGIPGQTYAAYFVRSRLTGPGPTGVELLWPDANVWPPEIDFNETYGGTTSSTATIHWAANNSQQQIMVHTTMTAWHTWGVIWTPTKVIYTLDGRIWGTITNQGEIPTIPMHLSLQSQTWCGASSPWACPTQPESMLVDWVAIYTPNS